MGRLGQLHATAFVSGASTGLGRAFARMLLGEGVRVWGTLEGSVAPGRPGRAATPGRSHPVTLDLADGAGRRARRSPRPPPAAGGGFDLVVNNAGYGVFGEFAARRVLRLARAARGHARDGPRR